MKERKRERNGLKMELLFKREAIFKMHWKILCIPFENNEKPAQKRTGRGWPIKDWKMMFKFSSYLPVQCEKELSVPQLNMEVIIDVSKERQTHICWNWMHPAVTDSHLKLLFLDSFATFLDRCRLIGPT